MVANVPAVRCRRRLPAGLPACGWQAGCIALFLFDNIQICALHSYPPWEKIAYAFYSVLVAGC